MPGLDPNQIVFVLSLLYSEPIILRHNPLINTYHEVTSSEPELVVSVSIFFPVSCLFVLTYSPQKFLKARICYIISYHHLFITPDDSVLSKD